MDINNYKEAIYDDLFFIFLFCIKKAKRKLVYQILTSKVVATYNNISIWNIQDYF